MRVTRKFFLGLLASFVPLTAASLPAAAQQQQRKPNILFIMGDDIGWMQPSIYHRGLMVGETPNIDRIGNEGAIFMHYYAEESCTAGRNSFFTGMHPLRTGMIPPQLPGSPSYLRPGTPALAWFLRDLGYNTGEFGKNHLGDHTDGDECKQSAPCLSHDVHKNPPYLSASWGKSDRNDGTTPHGIALLQTRPALRLKAGINHAGLVHVRSLHILRLPSGDLLICLCDASTYRRIACLALLRSLRGRLRAREHHGNERPQ